MYSQVVSKWGNSIGIRLPKYIADQVNLREGTNVSISISEGKLIVAPQRKSYTLEELLEKVTPENLHTEVDTGSCLGSEIW
ncbi:MAG: AbrB/MazE/SpoVT family DNA-binding domain-containing protein [Tolypothrix carrinoi HA7290-LM1]|jgi:antitoxin MazE|nr:AbrB/MazE/SpoVT family DNA-binding domain-containing protein [Tolypothrix carrinoi HA7290-LM1]